MHGKGSFSGGSRGAVRRFRPEIKRSRARSGSCPVRGLRAGGSAGPTDWHSGRKRKSHRVRVRFAIGFDSRGRSLMCISRFLVPKNGTCCASVGQRHVHRWWVDHHYSELHDRNFNHFDNADKMWTLGVSKRSKGYCYPWETDAFKVWRKHGRRRDLCVPSGKWIDARFNRINFSSRFRPISSRPYVHVSYRGGLPLSIPPRPQGSSTARATRKIFSFDSIQRLPRSKFPNTFDSLNGDAEGIQERVQVKYTFP